MAKKGKGKGKGKGKEYQYPLALRAIYWLILGAMTGVAFITFPFMLIRWWVL